MAIFFFKVPASLEFDVTVEAESLESAKDKIRQGEWDWNNMEETHGEWHSDRAQFLYEEMEETEE